MQLTTRTAVIGAVGCAAIAAIAGAAIHRAHEPRRTRDHSAVARGDRDDDHDRDRDRDRGRRGEDEREERERGGPMSVYRASAAELEVRNRVALAESAKIRQRALDRRRGLASPTVPGSTWVSLGPTEGNQDTTEKISQVISGRVNDIAIDPRDPRVVYIATSGGGVWKTYDVTATATSWLPLSDAQPSLAAGALALDPDRPDTLYVGYGDFYHTVGNGIAKTTDGGLTWSAPIALGGTYPAPSGLPANVRGIRAIGVHGSRVLVGTDIGLFASADAGAHFALVDLPNVSGNVLAEAVWSVVHAGDDHWIATGVTGCDEHSLPLGVRTAGQDPGPACRDGNDGEVWVSANGTTWTLATLPTNLGTGRIDVAIGSGAPPGSTVAYAMVGSVNLRSVVGLWRSLDGGQIWSDATGSLANPTLPFPDGEGGTFPGDCPSMQLSFPQTWYDQAITVDPTDANHVMIGGSLCGARTLNGLAAAPSWELVAHWSPNFDDISGTTEHGRLSYVHADWQTAKAVVAGGTVRVLAGTDGGLFTTDNIFAAATQAEKVTWTEHNRGITTHLMYSVASGDPATGDPFVLYGGLQDNGTRLRLDPQHPSVFNEVVGGDGIGAVIHAGTGGSTYFASIQGFRVYCLPATDCAKADSWIGIEALPGDPVPGTTPAAGDDSEPFLIRYGNVETDRDGQSVLTHTVGQVFVNVALPDGTPHFVPISQDLTSQGLAFTSVAASLTTPGLYGASAASGFRGSGPSPVPFYVSAQGNTMADWIAAAPVQPVGTTFHMSAASSIAFPPALPDGTAPGQVYIGAFVGALDDVLRTPPPDDQGRLYRTTDFGQTWTSIVGADPAHRLPNVAVHVVKYDPVSPHTIYAGTDLGVYVSTDDGTNWDRMGDGLPMAPVRDMYIARNQEFIRVATFGRGLWEIYPSATASHGALGNGDYDRNQQIDWIDVAAMASRLGVTPATPQPPLYSWILDVSGAGHDPPIQAIDDADLTALIAKLGGRP